MPTSPYVVGQVTKRRDFDSRIYPDVPRYVAEVAERAAVEAREAKLRAGSTHREAHFAAAEAKAHVVHEWTMKVVRDRRICK